MGRARVRGRKVEDNANHEDCGSGEEEKIPVPKKRGRPLKHLKEEVRHLVNKMEEEEEEEDGENVNSDAVTSKDKSQCDTTVLKKRKRKYKLKHKSEPAEEESADGTKSSSVGEPVKPSGLHRNSRRRKSKPRRAAEAVVECC